MKPLVVLDLVPGALRPRPPAAPRAVDAAAAGALRVVRHVDAVALAAPAPVVGAADGAGGRGRAVRLAGTAHGAPGGKNEGEALIIKSRSRVLSLLVLQFRGSLYPDSIFQLIRSRSRLLFFFLLFRGSLDLQYTSSFPIFYKENVTSSHCCALRYIGSRYILTNVNGYSTSNVTLTICWLAKVLRYRLKSSLRTCE